MQAAVEQRKGTGAGDKGSTAVSETVSIIKDFLLRTQRHLSRSTEVGFADSASRTERSGTPADDGVAGVDLPSSSSLPPTVLIVGSAETCEHVSSSMRALFAHELKLEMPDTAERTSIVEQFLPMFETDAPPVVSVPSSNVPNAGADQLASSDSGSSHSSGTVAVSSAVPATAISDSMVILEETKASSISSSSATNAAAVPQASSNSTAGSSISLARRIAQRTAGMTSGELVLLFEEALRCAVERARMQPGVPPPVPAGAAHGALNHHAAAASVGNDWEAIQALDASQDLPADVMAEFYGDDSVDVGVAASETAKSHQPARVQLTMADFDHALTAYQQRNSASSGTLATIPNVTWADIGGLEHVKREILDTIELPLRYPALFAAGNRQLCVVFFWG